MNGEHNRKTDDEMQGLREHLVSVKVAAELLGVSTRTVCRMIASGELAKVKIHRCTRLRESDIQKMTRGS